MLSLSGHGTLLWTTVLFAETTLWTFVSDGPFVYFSLLDFETLSVSDQALSVKQINHLQRAKNVLWHGAFAITHFTSIASLGG